MFSTKPMILSASLAATLMCGLFMSGAPSFGQELTQDEMTYDQQVGIALEWVAKDVLAVASNGGLRILDLSKDKAILLPSPELALRPMLDRVGDRLVGVATDGTIVQWRIGTWEELSRSAGFGAPRKMGGRDQVVLSADENIVLVCNGETMLAALSADSPLPMPLGYPGPKGIEDLGFGTDGKLRLFPSGWTWDPKDGSWRASTPFSFESGDGRNRLVWDPVADRTATYRFERPLELTLSNSASALGVDLGYREAMDMVLNRSGDRALVSFPGAEGGGGYGAQEFTGKGMLGTLEAFDAKTGELVAMLPREGLALSQKESPETRTVELGMRLASLGGGGVATIDFVEDHGQPSLFVRFRGPDLVAVAEVKLDSGAWPVYLASGGDLLSVCYPESRIDVFELENGYIPKANGETGELVPMTSIEISPVAQLPTSEPAAKRTVFAIRGDGNLFAMMGPDGNVSFANPRTGWPNEVVSVRLPKGYGYPLSARFRGAGVLPDGAGELVVTAQLEDGALVEWTLNKELVRWGPAIPVRARAQVSEDGLVRADILHGKPGNLESRGRAGELLWRVNLGEDDVQAIAIAPDGGVAVATGGQLLYVRASLTAKK
jgi:hypothetical protein